MNKKEIGQAVVARRDTLGVTQARLAKLSGVSVHTLSNLETGEAKELYLDKFIDRLRAIAQ